MALDASLWDSLDRRAPAPGRTVNGLDAGLAMLLLVAILLGLWNGIVRIALGMISVAVGLLCGVILVEPAATLLGRWVASPELRLVLGFLAVFALVLAAFSVLGWFLRRSLERLGLGWIDRALGGALSGTAVLCAAALLSVLASSVAPESAVLRGSLAVSILAPPTQAAWERLPPSWRLEGRRLRPPDGGLGPGPEKGREVAPPGAREPAPTPPGPTTTAPPREPMTAGAS